MNTFESFAASLSSVNEDSFERIALSLFKFQAANTPIYRAYLAARGVDPNTVSSIQSIPFLPISFFKTQPVRCLDWAPETTFISSGTTDKNQSRHDVWNLSFYHNHATAIFESRFGSLKNYHLLALLPSYLERQGSSLIAMIDHFIRLSDSPYSGYYLYNHKQLVDRVNELRNSERSVLIWGVSFALLDLAEAGRFDFSHCRVFETGGMKGRRKELVRAEFHEVIKDRFQITQVYSEYGMTELFSQAYSVGSGYYACPNGMKILIRDINDPVSVGLIGETGGINVIDLANFHSCAFVETQDLGRVFADGTFEILGRFDNSDLRGCSLLV